MVFSFSTRNCAVWLIFAQLIHIYKHTYIGGLVGKCNCSQLEYNRRTPLNTHTHIYEEHTLFNSNAAAPNAILANTIEAAVLCQGPVWSHGFVLSTKLCLFFSVYSPADQSHCNKICICRSIGLSGLSGEIFRERT